MVIRLYQNSSPRIQIKHRIKLAYIKLAFRTVFDEIKNDNPNITLKLFMDLNRIYYSC